MLRDILRSTTLASSLVLLVACAAPQQRAPFPTLGKQIDATAHRFGKGSCATTRTGIWEAEGGLVVEIARPQTCMFSSLSLVVNGRALPLTLADSSFYLRKVTYPIPGDLYEWTAASGKLFFRTEGPVRVGDIQGIVEPECQTLNCLDDAAASNVRK